MTQNMTNEDLAAVLERIGNLLDAQDENPYRARAYHNAAATLREAPEPVAELATAGNREALMELPGIGDSLAALLIEYVETGRSALLQRLQGEVSPADLFTQVPGIGETLAQRVVDALSIDSLEALELAAHDGRLAEVEGFGPDRVRAVQTALAGMLSQTAQRRAQQRTTNGEQQQPEPSIADLLDVDAEYRRRAEGGELPTIAPKRFNPEGEAWLPVLHTRRGEWSFTALFSNTARAHEAGKTNDWVVIYFEREGQEEEQRTVVTETQGPLKNKRVVRGRAADTRNYYDNGRKVG